MSTSNDLRAARFFYFGYIFSTLGLSIAIFVYSVFLSWVYSDEDRRVEYNYDTTASRYVIAYVIISILGAILFLLSLVALVDFCFSKSLISRFNLIYIGTSIVFLIGLFIVPLIVQIIMRQADGLYIWWMVWTFCEILLGGWSIYLIKRTDYMKDLAVRDYKPQEGDIIMTN